MSPSLILFLKIAMQMMCNHVLYRNDAADFAFLKWGLHYCSKFCFTSVVLQYHSGFSSATVGDPYQPLYVYTPALLYQYVYFYYFYKIIFITQSGEAL